jgi:hypothetical protein
MIDIEKIKILESAILKKLDVHNKKQLDPIERLKDSGELALEFANYLFHIRKAYYILKGQHDKKYAELYRHNKFSNALLLKTKSDIDAFINTDDPYLLIKTDMEYVEGLMELAKNIFEVYKQKEVDDRLICKIKMGVE